MSLVAGSKMRRAQQMALSHRPYADHLRWLLADVVESLATAESEGGAEIYHPLLARREVRTAGLLVLTPDRGLSGGLTTNILRAATSFLVAHPESKVITVGRKGQEFFRRTRANVIGSFTRLGDYPAFDDVRPISRLVADAYIQGEVDSVSIAYPRFINTVVQRPEIQDLLPATPPEDMDVKAVDYIYEPNALAVLGDLLPRYVDIQVYRAVLELAASEQSARMVAMRNATDAAMEMIQELTLVRNKVRQEQITKELLDITGGVEALAKS
jgi:F-type H+-transporting ATPase subunit gamma